MNIMCLFTIISFQIITKSIREVDFLPLRVNVKHFYPIYKSKYNLSMKENNNKPILNSFDLSVYSEKNMFESLLKENKELEGSLSFF